MLRAGSVTAAVILREFPDYLADGVAVYAGPGNNGGDAYVVAAQLSRAGVVVRLHAAEPPRTADAKRAAALVQSSLVHGSPTGKELLLVDGLLGTGREGPLRGTIADACERISYAHKTARIVALDIPTGVSATTGEVARGAVRAHLTVSYGTFKRGHLLARHVVGQVLLADIGLAGSAYLDDGAWLLADATTLSRFLPRTAWDSWKSRRGVLALAGGAQGMAGAITLACRAALASGAGLLHAIVDDVSVPVLQQSVPQAIAHTRASVDLPALHLDAIGIGPGFGRTGNASNLLRRLLENSHVPAVLDADALTLLALEARDKGREAAPLIADIVRGERQVICTPHPGEFARMEANETLQSFEQRTEAAVSFAMRSRATILLKGTPTVICSPDGEPPVVVARGTAALATGGSGDVLTGIITTLCGQSVPPASAAAIGAWVHGRAAEIATETHGGIRGVTLDDVLAALSPAWRELEQPASFPVGILATLPAVAS